MKQIAGIALRADGATFELLDQTRLPHAEVWLDATETGAMVGHIQRLSVRGAPLIGVAAALTVASLAERGADGPTLRAAIDALREARPTAVNLAWAMDRLRSVLDRGGSATDLVREAEAVHDEDVAACKQMGDLGADLVQPGEQILTHCNAGALATAGIGSAMGVLHRAHARGLGIHVWVNETRPLLQGARLTAWELGRLGIPYTLVTESMDGTLFRAGKVSRVVVGADRVARNGDFANKVGTYGVAVLARAHGVPFHAVAPWSTVDLECASGEGIPIEERAAEEVHGARGVRWAPTDARVFNPAFDVTPASLVTSLITERGVVTGTELAAGGLRRLA
ncbi:MAG TPA: S-methyl-5-thioribose-1-phosphate isomerase [Myxococcaceae bacterium]|nr:S-methyl-5-thioribose-1-phosphate isomerase [Myxococcaceae bacterium]